MKKILILIFALTVIFTLASCRKTPEPEHVVHVDEDANGLCDICNGIFIDNSAPSVTGTAIKDSIEKQLSETKSFRLTLESDLLAEESSWNYDESYDPTLGEYVDQTTYHCNEYSVQRHRLIDIWVSLDNDSINAKIITNCETFDGDMQSPQTLDPETVYIIDGYTYVKLNDEYYTKSEAVSDELAQCFNQLPEIFDVSEAQKDAFLDKLGVEIASVFDIKNYKASYSFDVTQAANEFLEYASGLDLNSDTVGEVLDEVLKRISNDLTSEKLIGEIDRLSDLTVNEALFELDQWLSDNYNTTIQGVCDAFFNNPELTPAVEVLVAEIMYLDVNDSEDREELDDIMSQLKSFKLKEFLEEEELGDMTLYELFARTCLPASAYMPKEEFLGEIASALDMTLAEFDDEVGGGFFEEKKSWASSVKVNQFNGKMDLKFDGFFSVESIDGETNFDVEIDAPSRVAGKRDYERVTLKVSAKLFEMSKDALVFSLPEKTKALEEKTYFFGDNYVSVDYYPSSSDSVEASFRFTVFDENHNKYEFNVYCEYNALGNRYNDTVGSFCLNGEWHFISAENDITFAFDPELGTFSILELPNWDLAGGTFYNGDDRVCVHYDSASGSSEVQLSLDMYLYDDNGNEICVYEYSYIDLDEIDDEYTVTIEYFYLNNEYYRFSYSDYQDLTIVLDRDSMTFTITQMPDWSLAYEL